MNDRSQDLKGKSPLPASEQDQPEPERPVPDVERREGEDQSAKPSQAEGERDGKD